MTTLTTDLQLAVDATDLPTEAHILSWAQQAYLGDKPSEVTVRIVTSDESAELNGQYRGKPHPTNVLSFPFEAPPGIPVSLLGDLVVCADVVRNEARSQGKGLEAHWAHMVIHGMLHLQGYDHINDNDAAEMEALEIRLLAAIGIANPYEIQETDTDS